MSKKSFTFGLIILLPFQLMAANDTSAFESNIFFEFYNERYFKSVANRPIKCLKLRSSEFCFQSTEMNCRLPQTHSEMILLVAQDVNLVKM